MYIHIYIWILIFRFAHIQITYRTYTCIPHIYACTYTYAHTQAVRPLLTNHPPHSRTHAHLIGVGRIGASLQHRAQTGHESEACTIKQERVLVVVCNDGVLH